MSVAEKQLSWNIEINLKCMKIDVARYTIFDEDRSCPICTSGEFCVLSKKMQFGFNCRTVICQRCGFIFVSPAPTKEAYKLFYIEAYSKLYKKIHPNIEFLEIIESKAEKDIFSKIEKFRAIDKSNVLEIGPGNGRFLELLKRRGADCSAIEPSDVFRRKLSGRGIRIVGDFLETTGTDQQFDIIFLFQVLEHFHDPKAAVMKICSLLGRSGIVVLDVPNVLRPFRNFDKFFLRYVHLSYFSPTSLCRLFEECGFELLYLDTGQANNIYSPQSIFLIARVADGVNIEASSMYNESAAEVVKIINSYRSTYPFLIAPRLVFSRLKWRVRRFISKSFFGTFYRYLKRILFSSHAR